MDKFIILNLVIVSRIYQYIETHQIMHLNIRGSMYYNKFTKSAEPLLPFPSAVASGSHEGKLQGPCSEWPLPKCYDIWNFTSDFFIPSEIITVRPLLCWGYGPRHRFSGWLKPKIVPNHIYIYMVYICFYVWFIYIYGLYLYFIIYLYIIYNVYFSYT